MTTVPYKGTAPAIADLLGGQIDLLCDQTTNTTSQIEAKKVKPYAVTTLKRLTTPGAQGPADAGRVGPEELPGDDLARPVRAQGHARAGAQEDQRRAEGRAEGPGVHQEGRRPGRGRGDDKRMEPAEHKKFVQAEVARFGPVVKAAGVYAD
jgi:hypothetical protein